MSIINTVTFEVRDDGLYQANDGGEFRRIARHHEIAAISCRNGEFVIAVGNPQRAANSIPQRSPLKWRRADLPAEALAMLRSRLLNRADVIDVARRNQSSSQSSVHLARAFKLQVRGLGMVFAVKPEALRDWLPGSLVTGRVIAALDKSGWLIRGADGKSTRQIVIPGLGRGRYYCLKLAAADGEAGPGEAELNCDEDGMARKTEPDPGTKSRAAFEAARRNWSSEWE